MDVARARGGTGWTSDERPQSSSPADARDGRLRTCGIGDAEVAVLQGEPGDPVARRASVNGVPCPAVAEFWRSLVPGDMRQNALNHIRSRHVRQSAPAMTRGRPPQCGQSRARKRNDLNSRNTRSFRPRASRTVGNRDRSRLSRPVASRNCCRIGGAPSSDAKGDGQGGGARTFHALSHVQLEGAATAMHPSTRLWSYTTLRRAIRALAPDASQPSRFTRSMTSTTRRFSLPRSPVAPGCTWQFRASP